MSMNRRILMSVLAIAMTLTLVGGATFAYFSDTETSSGNTFTAGTLDLMIRDGGIDWFDGIGAEWTLSDMKPGDIVYGSVDFKNFGSIYADHMEITCFYAITDPLGPESDTEENTSADKMAGEMIISKMVYSYDNIEVDCLPRITDANGNLAKDLYDLRVGEVDDLPLPQAGIQLADISMTLQFNSGAGNDFQGDILDTTFMFTLNQDRNQ